MIAAQSIGEPSTQLTLDTFHDGGVAGAAEASGIDRVKQLFEVRPPKNPAIVAPFDGVISFEETPEGGKFGKIRLTGEVQKNQVNFLLREQLMQLKDLQNLRSKRQVRCLISMKILSLLE